VRDALADSGVPSATIGVMTRPEEGLVLVRGGAAEPLPEVERDELARWIETESR
jgi:hypothetical protein